jgi:hypothetical protein
MLEKKVDQGILLNKHEGGHDLDRMIVGLTELHLQSVPIATNFVCSNLAQSRSTRYIIMW